MRLRRNAITLLAGSADPRAPVATQLYAVLLSAHGHIPGRRFAIVPDGLKSHGVLVRGRAQIYAAIQFLVEVGLIIRVRGPLTVKDAALYTLSQSGKEKQERGPLLTLVSETSTQRGFNGA